MKAAATSDLEALEIEIHGYLDGELSEQHVAKVEEYLDGERPAAEKLVHYGAQGDLIRRLYGPLINRPMPPRMAGRFQAIHEQRYRRKIEPEPEVHSKGYRRPFVVLIMLAALLAIGVTGVWFFKPTFLEPVSALIKALPVYKLSSF